MASTTHNLLSGAAVIFFCAYLFLLAMYILYFKDLASDVKTYHPRLAWLRAGMYFCFCNLVSFASGTMEAIATSPIVTSGNNASTQWWIFTIACYVGVFCFYWLIWARWTQTFDRKLHLVPALCFGLAWGVSVGQLLCSFYFMINKTGWSKWAVYFLSWAAVGAWQGLFQDLYWDIYVTPEHDTPWSVTMKVICSHIPNVTMTLLHLVLYDNLFLFVTWQTIALLGATIFMKFPPFWTTEHIDPPSTEATACGLLRATGAVSLDKSGERQAFFPK